jgi:[acyl-carrier-protein] S-malonyltransferase
MKKFAFIFPGQGSQSLGMVSDYAAQFPVVNETFEQASQALGYDVAALINNGPQEKLNQTQYTQPALLAASVAMWKVWQSSTALEPTFMAGHSLGEYSALVCAGVLGFSDAIKIVAKRGQFMQEAVPQGVGAMAAIIGLTDAQVQEVCEKVGPSEDVCPANYNSIGQVVIAGKKASVEEAVTQATALGAKLAKLIPVSVPSHCMLMQPAAAKLKEILLDTVFQKPKYSVVNNVDVNIESDADMICDALVKQLYSPVQWVKTIQFIQAQQVITFAECGPGKILTAMTKRIDKQLSLSMMLNPEQMQKFADGLE